MRLEVCLLPTFHPMKIHVIFSGHGAGNIGDEAMMKGFLSLHPLPQGSTIEVYDTRTSAVLNQLPSSYNYINFNDDSACKSAVLSADCVFIVGTTIVTEMLGLDWPLRILGSKYAFCHENGIPIHAVGIGADRLRSEEAVQLFNKGFLPVESWTVRSERTRRNLIALGVNPGRVVAAADLAWLLPTHDVDKQWAGQYRASLGIKKDEPILGVNIVNEKWKDDNAIKMETAAALDWVVRELKWQVVFFCNETREGEFFDKEAAIKTAAFMKSQPVIVPNTYFTPEQMIALISCCNMTISWRYHFTVFSAIGGAVALSVPRGEKLIELADELNGIRLGTPAALTAKKIKESIIHAINNYDSLKYRQDVSVEALRKRSLFNNFFIDKLSPGSTRLNANSLLPAALELTRYKEALTAPAKAGKEYTVTVIVSTYMSEAFIGECLDGLREQSIWGSIEVIVIDAASPQNERALISEFQSNNPDVMYVRTAEKVSIYAAWNIGLRLAGGRYITVLSTNDRLRRDALEIMSKTLDARPDIALVYGDSYVTATPHESFERNTGSPSMVWPEHQYEDLLKVCRIGPHPVWRKSASARIGFFDETYTANGDQEYWLRMGGRYKFLHIPEFTGLYWHNPQSLSMSGGIPLMETHRAQSLYQKRYIDNLKQRVTLAGTCRPLYIWGTGRLALITNHLLVNLGLPVSGFIGEGHENMLATVPIFGPEHVLGPDGGNPFIIIASEDEYKSIKHLLDSAGYVDRADYWTNIHELSWVWDLHNPI
ncbi:MAG: glycosyltransferase [Nitrospirae bacterium]|nr:glycosyltransferase [Nitrospirota bacterium]